jgi:hypothetical protein
MSISRGVLASALLATLVIPRLLRAQQAAASLLCRDSAVVTASADGRDPCASHGGPLRSTSVGSAVAAAPDSTAAAASHDTTKRAADKAKGKKRSAPARTARDAWARDTVACADGSAPDRQGVCETKKAVEYMKRP